MLSKILTSYSEGELAELAGPETIDEYQRLYGKTVEKSVLVQAVKTLHGYGITSLESQRRNLIDRMSIDQVRVVTTQLLKMSPVHTNSFQDLDEYAVLQLLANRWPDQFTSILGFEDAKNLLAESKQAIAGISAQNCTYPTYPYQRDIVRKISALIRQSESRRCLLHLPTGSGKTRTAMNIAAEHLRENEDGLVLWLADTTELCTQARNEFTQAWKSIGNKRIKIYSYFSDTNISLGGIEDGFIVAGLQKIYTAKGSREYSILYNQLRKHVTLIIFDEAHKAIAPTYAQAVNDMLNTVSNTFFLGLTATPGRKLKNNSDEDEKLTHFFECNKVTMTTQGYTSPIKYLVENKYLAKTEFINIEYEGNKILLANDLADHKLNLEIRQALSEDDNRNLCLLDVIEREYGNGSSIIVFACSVEHSRYLATLLAFNGIKAYSLDSKHDDQKSRRYKISDYASGNVRVLVNFNILTAGFDAPVTNVVLIARPTDSLVQYSQMAGRAMRGKASGGNDNCRVYTVRDDIPAFTSVTKAFSHWDSLWTEV